MADYRYTLEKRGKKYYCPSCGKLKFTRYIDTHKNEHLPEEYGRCEREIKCTYHLNPYRDGYSRDNWSERGRTTEFSDKQVASETDLPNPSHIPFDIFMQSRRFYQSNNFVVFLTTLFDAPTINQLLTLYHVGTSDHWPGATIFWQITEYGKIRSGKIMLYNSETGRRVKQPFNHINWIHTVYRMDRFNLQQVLFGEHILRHRTECPVGILESEKSAIIASAYFPHMVWLATGSLSNLSVRICQSLKGRTVYLFPDLGAFEKWNDKVMELIELIPETAFEISDLLERSAGEDGKANGFDLADYLIRFPHKTFFLKKSNNDFIWAHKDVQAEILPNSHRESKGVDASANAGVSPDDESALGDLMRPFGDTENTFEEHITKMANDWFSSPESEVYKSNQKQKSSEGEKAD